MKYGKIKMVDEKIGPLILAGQHGYKEFLPGLYFIRAAPGKNKPVIFDVSNNKKIESITRITNYWG